MFPTLFHLGQRPVPTYTVLLDLGLLAGLGLAFWLWHRRRQAPLLLLDAITVMLLGGVVGGRLAYVGANWVYFAEHLQESLAIWQGGLSFHGAVAGGLLGLILFTRRHPALLWPLADTVAAGVALSSVFGWLAALAAGSSYGVLGRGTFFFLAPDVYGVEAPRFAVQPAGALQSLVLLALLLLLLRLKVRPGIGFASYLILYFGGQFFLEMMRGDEAMLIAGWRLPQLADALFALIGAGLLIALRATRAHDAMPAEARASTIDTALPVPPILEEQVYNDG